MRKLTALVALLVVVALLAVGDFAARRYAEDRIQHQIDSRQAGAVSSVTISSFPFVPRLLILGKVDKVTAHVRNVSVGSFALDRVDLTVTGVKLDRGQLVHGKVVVTGIRTGTVSALLSEQEVDNVLHVPVSFGDGSVHLTVGGVTLSATISVVGNELRLGAVGHDVSVPIPELPVLPCVAGVSVQRGFLVLSCTFHQVPAALAQAAA
jgi:hypothetical protein